MAAVIDIDNVIADSRIRRAFEFLSEREPEIEADQIRLTAIPAPPFGEAARARAFSAELSKTGLCPYTDGIGNVIGSYDGIRHHPLVIGAHLDTVFPLSTALNIQRKGRTLLMPGISDNGSGLVALNWALRAAKACDIRFQRSVVVIGNVGEEGKGNLRGIRHLFETPPWPDRECDFIAVDSAGLQRITHQALGSRRFHVRMTGPGGHSWADFGRPNPVQAMATAIHLFGNAARRPGTSFNFGVVRGGISVNAIPSDACMEVDLRATSLSDLGELENHLKGTVNESARSAGVECRIEMIGERPSGMTPAGAPIVRAALDITRRLGVEPQLDMGSTDANIPMSMGIPAIAIGAGGACGSIHTFDEWFDPAHRDLGLHRLLALIAVLAGLSSA